MSYSLVLVFIFIIIFLIFFAVTIRGGLLVINKDRLAQIDYKNDDIDVSPQIDYKNAEVGDLSPQIDHKTADVNDLPLQTIAASRIPISKPIYFNQEIFDQPYTIQDVSTGPYVTNLMYVKTPFPFKLTGFEPNYLEIAKKGIQTDTCIIKKFDDITMHCQINLLDYYNNLMHKKTIYTETDIFTKIPGSEIKTKYENLPVLRLHYIITLLRNGEPIFESRDDIKHEHIPILQKVIDFIDNELLQHYFNTTLTHRFHTYINLFENIAVHADFPSIHSNYPFIYAEYVPLVGQVENRTYELHNMMPLEEVIYGLKLDNDFQAKFKPTPMMTRPKPQNRFYEKELFKYKKYKEYEEYIEMKKTKKIIKIEYEKSKEYKKYKEYEKYIEMQKTNKIINEEYEESIEYKEYKEYKKYAKMLTEAREILKTPKKIVTCHISIGPTIILILTDDSEKEFYAVTFKFNKDYYLYYSDSSYSVKSSIIKESLPGFEYEKSKYLPYTLVDYYKIDDIKNNKILRFLFEPSFKVSINNIREQYKCNILTKQLSTVKRDLDEIDKRDLDEIDKQKLIKTGGYTDDLSGAIIEGSSKKFEGKHLIGIAVESSTKGLGDKTLDMVPGSLPKEKYQIKKYNLWTYPKDYERIIDQNLDPEKENVRANTIYEYTEDEIKDLIKIIDEFIIYCRKEMNSDQSYIVYFHVFNRPSNNNFHAKFDSNKVVEYDSDNVAMHVSTQRYYAQFYDKMREILLKFPNYYHEWQTSCFVTKEIKDMLEKNKTTTQIRDPYYINSLETIDQISLTA